MKQTLLQLKTTRSALMLIIRDLKVLHKEVDRERKPRAWSDLQAERNKLNVINSKIARIGKEVDELDKQWAKGNVYIPAKL